MNLDPSLNASPNVSAGLNASMSLSLNLNAGMAGISLKAAYPHIAFMSTYIPKKCGLATYTHHLREAVRGARAGRGADSVVAMCEPGEKGDYGPLWTLSKPDADDYRKMADAINQSSVDIVSLQHEFGIFGGEAGRFVNEFLRRVDKPVVTTFHTVFEHPAEPYASVQQEIAEWSDHLIVMNRKAIGYLHESFGIPASKISFIPHGTPVPDRSDRAAVRMSQGWERRKVLFTFGLLGRSKGIEFALRALAGAVPAVPELLYVIAGQTHPEVRKHEGEAYREELKTLVAQLGLEHHVVMIDRYIPEDELSAFIAASDLYITPYPGMQQITSGTLAYAAGLGRPILSTPYCYAKDLVQGNEEMLLPYGDVEAWTSKIVELFYYPGTLQRWERIMAQIGDGMQWPQVGAKHLRLFSDIVAEREAIVADVG